MSNNITPFTMPKWGIEMEEGVIREWHADVGQTVSEGDLFVVIETDKIANDVELEFTGTLRKRIGEVEETYPVGALIAVFADQDVPDAEIDNFVANFKAVDAGFAHGDDDIAPAAQENVPKNAPATESAPTTFTVPDGLSISPKALELAQALGVDLSQVTGSGRNGRVSLQDVEQAAKAQGVYQEGDPTDGDAAPSYDVVKLSSMRRTIAKRLSAAARDVPMFFVRSKINMGALMKLREEKKATGGAPSINDYIIKASALALMKTPDVNVHFAEDAIHKFHHADINVAVAVPGGLIAPVVRHAEGKSVDAIGAEMKDLAERARAEKLEPQDYAPGSFSISNLGPYGVSDFDAFINPPMGAILAVGSIERIASPGGEFDNIMTATLTCDHRAIDGALAGEFLQALKQNLENPAEL